MYQDSTDAGLEVTTVSPDPASRKVSSSTPVTYIQWVTFRDQPGREQAQLFHLVHHTVFDGRFMLKQVTWCGRVRHASRLAPATVDAPRISENRQCHECREIAYRFIRLLDPALRGR